MPELSPIQNALLLAAICGTWLGVNRWRTLTFRRARVGVLWVAGGKLLLSGK